MKIGLGAGVDGCAVVGEPFEDLLGGFMPYEGATVLVPGVGPGEDVSGEFFHVAVGGALQFLGRQRGEPPLDEIHPRSVCWCEMEVKAAVAQQPALHGGRFVGREIVQDHMHIQFGRDLPVDLVQEGDQIGAGMGLRISVITLPVATSSAANRSQVPLRS